MLMKYSKHPYPYPLSQIFGLFLFSILMLQSAVSQAQQEPEILAGPMLGYIEMQEANIWVQTTEPAVIQVRYEVAMGSEAGKTMLSEKARANEYNSNTGQIKIRDLEPGTTYKYEVLLDGKAVSRNYPTTFTTQELWQWRTDPPAFSAAFGSCLYTNDPKYDRPGEGYGGPSTILREINALNPDLMLWLGDNYYYREPDFYSMARLDYRIRDSRSLDDMQPLLANAVNLAIWDDHDYGPNNSDRTYRLREEALELFKRYWINPQYGTAQTDGVFFRYKYADVEFFMMDDRYHRAPNRLDDPEKPFFGDEQLQWLKESLVNSRATFKIVAVGNQVTNVNGGHECFCNFESEYNELMSFLSDEGIEGVVFLSGDRHFTELLKNEREGAYPLYEFTSSPLSSGTYSSIDESPEFDNPNRVDGTIIYKERNFGMLRVSGKRDDRTLEFKAYTATGELKWTHEIHEKELKMPNSE